MRIKVSFIFGLLISLIAYLHKPAKLNSINFSNNLEASKTNNSIQLQQKSTTMDIQKSNKSTTSLQIVTKKSEVRRLVEREVIHLYDVDPNPKNTEDNLRSFATTLNSDELEELTTIISNEYAEIDQRTLGVYLLTLAGPIAQQYLIKVFFNPTHILDQPALVHSFQEKQQEHEYSIRTLALQAIEQNMHQTKDTFISPETLKNSYLKGLLKIVRLGERMKEPLLKQFIDKNLQQESL